MAIKTCVCKSDYQDKKHGPKKRVANPTNGAVPGYRCTVCGMSIDAAKKQAKVKKDAAGEKKKK